MRQASARASSVNCEFCRKFSELADGILHCCHWLGQVTADECFKPHMWLFVPLSITFTCDSDTVEIWSQKSCILNIFTTRNEISVCNTQRTGLTIKKILQKNLVTLSLKKRCSFLWPSSTHKHIHWWLSPLPLSILSPAGRVLFHLFINNHNLRTMHVGESLQTAILFSTK
jgi:hypothetical protein